MKQGIFGRVPHFVIAGVLSLIVSYSNQALAQDHLKVYGSVMSNDVSMHDVSAVISDEQGEIMNILLDDSGNFNLEVPANDVFTISISSPGTVRKNLVLNTNSLKRIKKERDRSIELVVSLQALRPQSPDSVTVMADIDGRGNIRFDKVQ